MKQGHYEFPEARVERGEDRAQGKVCPTSFERQESHYRRRTDRNLTTRAKYHVQETPHVRRVKSKLWKRYSEFGETRSNFAK